MTDDYASFGYLDHQPAAFARFPLAAESGRVPAYDGGFDRATVARAEALLAGSITISLHDHPVRFPADMAHTPPYNRTGRQHTAFDGLAASGLTAVFDNMMDGTAYVTGNTPWQWDDVVTDLGMRQADIAHQDTVVVVQDPQRHPVRARNRPGRHRVRPRGGHADRQRPRQAGHPVRPRHPADRHRLLRLQRPRRGPERAGRLRPDRVRPRAPCSG